MQFVNPRTDFAFNKIFNMADSKSTLLSFLNAILDFEFPYSFVDITLFDFYQAPKIVGLRNRFLDVSAVDGTGKSYIIEIQVLNVEGLAKHTFYNACTDNNQINKEQDYRLLTDVIGITITNFVLFPERTAKTNKFKLSAGDGDFYSDDLELVFAELPKFTQTENELDSIIDKWLYFLKHVDDLTIIPDTLSNVPEIKHAFDLANRASWTAKELEEQESYEMIIQDQRGAISLAEKKAKAQGVAETLETVGINLLRTGMAIEQVAQLTGLTAEQVAALQP